jgi:hypothetical protein
LLPVKPLLILSVVLITLIIGGVLLVRRYPAWIAPRNEAKRYPHEHLPSSGWEAKAKLHVIDYTLRKDETLANVAALRYGHQNYYRVIKLFNHIEDERQVPEEFKLRLPDVSAILAEEGLTRVIPNEVELILCSRAKYDKVVDQLWTLRAQSGSSYEVPENVKLELLQAADDLQRAAEGLKSNKSGVSKVPESMIRQLEQSMAGMRELAGGEHADPNGYDIDMVQQRYAFAIAYGIIWARAELSDVSVAMESYGARTN